MLLPCQLFVNKWNSHAALSKFIQTISHLFPKACHSAGEACYRNALIKEKRIYLDQMS